ncbi:MULTISPECIES: hypothetical protein [Microbacterium]|uniref:hypothetical protein n=1 Tax=Microbacterium TaxID=33882 RepID=UPI0027833E94|nr:MULTISPECIES: hypothetical protein [Microbacterium]MDQ1082033.1 hypothetical protein [Microbacterium sp. SORGH_AS_0344]MDQ1169199.1 hypothetical protein [Microbacterium proteolyticum]
MAYFIALGILSLAGIVGTVWLIRTDGYSRIPTDPARVASVEDRSAPSRAATVGAAPAAEAARPTLNLGAPSAAPMTAPLRIVTAD